MDTAQRFQAKIRRDSSGCLLWTAAQDGRGYGRFSVKGQPVAAYRFAWEQRYGPIPKGMMIDHLCHTPLCVNVAHLEVVTPAENVRRGDASRIREECKRGHRFDEHNIVFVMQRGKLIRLCRLCDKERRRAANRKYMRNWRQDHLDEARRRDRESKRRLRERRQLLNAGTGGMVGSQG